MELLAVLEELVEQELISELLQLRQGHVVVGVAPLGDVCRLLGDLVGGIVILGAESLGKLKDSIDFVVVGLHGGQQSLVFLDQGFGLRSMSYSFFLCY